MSTGNPSYFQAQGLKDIPRKSSTVAKPSRRPVDFSDSDREESEYETEGEEEERSPERKMEDSEPEWQDSEDEEQEQGQEEEEAAEGGASQEEAEVCSSLLGFYCACISVPLYDTNKDGCQEQRGGRVDGWSYV